jgi:prepilin-type N-terminal cleavage/methylation domain-containing protein
MQPAHPRAFTLIELTVSLAIASILMLALGSTIALVSRALPTHPDRALQATDAWAALDRLCEELAVATLFSSSGSSFTLDVQDQTNDASVQKVVYTLDAGGELTREDASGPVVVATNLGTLTLTPVTAAGRVLRITILWQHTQGVTEPYLRTVECLNRPLLS